MKNNQTPELAGLGLRATAVIIDTAILFIPFNFFRICFARLPLISLCLGTG